MNLSGVRTGDIVKVDKRGRRFFAMVVDGRQEGGLSILPLDASRYSYRTCTAREVIGIWRQTKATVEAQVARV